MALTIADVEAVASLARLSLTDGEKQSLRDQLSVILENIEIQALITALGAWLFSRQEPKDEV